jgi:hypothetical protein
MPAIVSTAWTRVQERYGNVQRGLLALYADLAVFPKVKSDAAYMRRLNGLYDALNRFTRDVYAPAIKLFAEGSPDAANDFFAANEKTIEGLQNEMAVLNAAQAKVTGRELGPAQKQDPTPSWLRQAFTYSLWGLGIYFGGKLLLSWYEKRQRYPSPPRYARRR